MERITCLQSIFTWKNKVKVCHAGLVQYWWPAALFSMLSLVHLPTASLVLVFAVASFAELEQ
jgi:hypothetical protein